MTIQDEVALLKKEQDEKRLEAERLMRLVERFPDLRKHVGRWNKIAYCSSVVNPMVDRFDLRHNCGCCNDSPLELWPYLETPDGKVYSSPPVFRVGEKHWISGDRPEKGWRDTLKKALIPEIIIGAVSMHFEVGRKARIEAAEDESEYDPESDGDL